MAVSLVSDLNNKVTTELSKADGGKRHPPGHPQNQFSYKLVDMWGRRQATESKQNYSSH